MELTTMKKFAAFVMLLFCTALACAQSSTPNIGLQIPATGSNNWYIPLNYDFSKIDLLLGGVQPIPALNITNNLNVGGIVTAGGFTGVGGGSFPTINGTIHAGHCAFWATLTTLGDAGAACGSGGGGGGVASINGTAGAFSFTGSVSCVGTACSFGSLTSTTYILVSQLGCAAQNTNLNTGGGTDDTSCINAALANATASHPVILVQDGASLVHGILGPATGNWGIIGLGSGLNTSTNSVYGTGFYLANGSTASTISSTGSCADPSNDLDTTPTPIRNANILLSDFAINGNAGNNTAYCYGVDIASMNGVKIENLTIFNQSHYSIRFDNVGYSTIHGSTIIGAATLNSDPVHIDGSTNDIVISDNKFTGGDDVIALNAPEGWCGPIKRIEISNNTVLNGLEFMRVYGDAHLCGNGNGSNVSYVDVSNFSGNATNAIAFFGGPATYNNTAHLPNMVDHFKWTNSTISSPFGIAINETGGSIEFSNIDWTDGSCVISGFTMPACGFIGAVKYDDAETAIPINSLTLTDVHAIRTPAGNLSGYAIDTMDAQPQSGSSSAPLNITTLTVHGFDAQSNGGSYWTPVQMFNLRSDTFSSCIFSGININSFSDEHFDTFACGVDSHISGILDQVGNKEAVIDTNINDTWTELMLNRNTFGYVGDHFLDTSGTQRASFGYGNSNTYFTNWRGMFHLATYGATPICFAAGVPAWMSGASTVCDGVWSDSTHVLDFRLTPTVGGNALTVLPGVTSDGANGINLAANGLTNSTISFGGNYSADAIDLFNNGSDRYGLGVNGGEMQLYVPASAGHFSFSRGLNGLQATGVNEFARLSPASGATTLTVAQGGSFCTSTSATSAATNQSCLFQSTTAPTGACSLIGWTFSQDGKATFCNGTSWGSTVTSTGNFTAPVLRSTTASSTDSGTANNGYITTARISANSSATIGWTSSATDSTPALDSAISRTGASAMCAGNGTAGNCSGTFTATNIAPVYNVSGTLQSNAHTVIGSGSFTTGAGTITFSGSAVFSSSSSYSCSATSDTSAIHTISITYTSGSAFAVVTDNSTGTYHYVCTGN